MGYIAREDPAAARQVGSRIWAAVSRLDRFPEIGLRGRRHGTRELFLPRLPYVLVYQCAPDRVTILRILHTSMRWP